VLDAVSDRTLRERYGFMKYPALVFVRGDALLGTLCGIRDWSEYLTAIAEFLAADARGSGRIPIRDAARSVATGEERA
jgi:hydrogenase-1 operon protein HyaE